MKKIFLSLLAILALLLCGCQSQPDPDAIDFSTAPTLPAEEIPELPVLQHSMSGSEKAPKTCAPTSDGIFIAEDTDYGLFSRIYFAELGTGVVYPICAKVNCNHETEECTAMVYGWDYHFDGTYFYHISTWNSANSYLVRQKPDGSDQEIVFRTAEESNQPTSITTITSIVYEGEMVYFTTYGTTFDMENENVSNCDMIAVGNLATGRIITIPLKFSDDSSASSLILQGKYGDYLIAEYTRRTSVLREQYAITGFLLDMNTHEITVLYEDSYSSTEPPCIAKRFSIDEGIIILDEGRIQIIDLEEQKCYRLTDESTVKLWVLDGNWIYNRLEYDATESGYYVQSITAGESRVWPENMEDIESMDFAYRPNHAELDYFIVDVWVGDEKKYATIQKDDFWAGNREFQFYPDWAALF